MKRRRFIASLPLVALSCSQLGCHGEPVSGPVDIKWDRETDPRCSMVISDKRFAAQIRDPAGKVWKFDDIGCAMFWLAQQSFTEDSPKSEYWVADYQGGAWLDARQANYLAGKKSPMGYHFAALAAADAGTITYREMKQQILSRGK